MYRSCVRAVQQRAWGQSRRDAENVLLLMIIIGISSTDQRRWTVHDVGGRGSHGIGLDRRKAWSEGLGANGLGGRGLPSNFPVPPLLPIKAPNWMLPVL